MECLMDHIVLNMDDEEKMIAFFTSVLKLAPERLEEYRAGKVPFPSVRLNKDTIIDLFPKQMWQKGAMESAGRHNLNHFCMSMSKETWDELKQRLELNSIEIEDGPVRRWGSHGTGVSLYFRDPENNLIEARYYEKGDTAEDCLLGS